MSWAWVHRSIGKTRCRTGRRRVSQPPAICGRQRRGRPGVHHVGVADEAARLAALRPRRTRAGRRSTGRSAARASVGSDRVVVVGLAVVVEGVPDRERHAEEPLPADQPVAVEAARPSCRSGAACRAGSSRSRRRARPSRRAGRRRGRRCGCTTAGSRRSRAACRPSRRSSPSAASASARPRGRRTRAAARPSPRGRENAVLPASSAYAVAPAPPVSHSGVSRMSRPSRPITVRTGSWSSRHHWTSVRSPNVQHIAMPAPLSGSASVVGEHRDLDAEDRRGDRRAEQRLVALVVRVGDQGDARPGSARAGWSRSYTGRRRAGGRRPGGSGPGTRAPRARPGRRRSGR